MWTLFGWWKIAAAWNGIQISTVLSCTMVLKLFSPPQTFRQLFNYSCLKYRDLLFMIFTLQNSITALWLKQWLQLALSHIQYRKTFQLCDMCPALGLSSTGTLRCNISAQQWNFAVLPYSSETLKNTSTCHVHKVEDLLFWTGTSDSKKQYSELKLVGVTEQSVRNCTLQKAAIELHNMKTLNA